MRSEFKIKDLKTSLNSIKLDQISAPVVELCVCVLYCSSNCAYPVFCRDAIV